MKSSQQGSYPFGMLMPGRSLSLSNYRFGFNSQEKDNELKGDGMSLNFTFRIHDTRLGRFLSIDPLNSKYPFYSPYAFSGNRVIDSYELEGLEPVPLKPEMEGIMALPAQELNYIRRKTYSRTIERSNSKIEVTTSNYIDGKTNVTLTLGEKVKQQHVTDKTASIVADNLERSGNNSATISSAFRPPAEQARVMYENIELHGVQYNKNMYSPAGDKVVTTYENFSPEQNCSKAECLEAMTNTILEVGPGNVSPHSANPKVYNTVDIAPSSLKNNEAFKNELKDNSRNYNGGDNAPIKKYLPPPKKDPAHHIEIPQKN